MKNRKWLTYTLGILLTLIALAVVGLAGFRAGMMQNAFFPRMGDRAERPAFDKNANPNGDPNGKQDFGGAPRGNDFNQRGFERGHRGMSIFGGLFGLIHVAILALLLWFGYKFVQKSGWRLVRTQAGASLDNAVRNTVDDEKKDID